MSKSLLKLTETILLDKFLYKIGFVKITKGILLKMGFIGILLMLSTLLVFLAGIVSLVWVLFENM